MGQYLNPNNEVFKRIVNSGVYVDKTGLLAFTNNRIKMPKPFIASIRPRRFGKSTAAHMLEAYYSKGCDSKELFRVLEISEDPSFESSLNKYDVISLDIQAMRSTYLAQANKDFPSVVQFIQNEVLNEVKHIYPQYVNENTKTLQQALTQCNLSKEKLRFVVIIDEWDCLFREDKDNQELINEYINFLRSIFKGKEADNFIALAYITGILPIKKYGTQSALNNFSELTMVSPGRIGEYIGFTEDEVKDLCERYDMSFEDMRKWYDGYYFRKAGHIYCPNSVMEAIENDDFDSYWSKTETFKSLKMYIEMNFDGLKDKVIQMLAGERCKIEPESFQNDMTSMTCSDDVLTLLVHLGYLAYDSETGSVFIPNLEVRKSFKLSTKNGTFSETAKAIDNSAKLLEATLAKRESEVAERIEEVHLQNINALAYNSEQSLTTVILLAYYKARDEYDLIREYPSGYGFADIVMLPKRNTEKPALIIELKWNKDADTAIRQIKEKKYPDSLKEYQGNMLLVGISYDKDTKKHECKIEPISVS